MSVAVATGRRVGVSVAMGLAALGGNVLDGTTVVSGAESVDRVIVCDGVTRLDLVGLVAAP